MDRILAMIVLLWVLVVRLIDGTKWAFFVFWIAAIDRLLVLTHCYHSMHLNPIKK